MRRSVLACGLTVLLLAACRQPAPRGDGPRYGQDLVEVEVAEEPRVPAAPTPAPRDTAALARWTTEFSAWSDRFDDWTRRYERHERARDDWNERFAAWSSQSANRIAEEERSAADRSAMAEELREFRRRFDRWVDRFQAFERRQRERLKAGDLRQARRPRTELDQ